MISSFGVDLANCCFKILMICVRVAFASSNIKTYTVKTDLATNAHAIGSTAYNTNASNLLLIGSDGKLTIEDTWDCGTY